MICKHLTDCLPLINTAHTVGYEISAHEPKQKEIRNRSRRTKETNKSLRVDPNTNDLLLFWISIFFQVEECENF